MSAVAKRSILALPGKATNTSLELPAGLSFEEWKKAGATLQRCERAVMWWLGDWWALGEHKYGELAAQATDEYSYQTLRNAGWVCTSIELSRRRDNLSFNHHAEVAALEAKVADALLDKAEAEGWNRNELRREVRLLKGNGTATTPLPDGQYRVLYADPPWKYNDKLIEGYGAAEHHYRPMSIEELCEPRFAALAANNAVLFIWATSPFLEKCFAVIRAWDFEYKSSFIWDKVKHNYGHYNSVRHEFLLVCTKGSCTPDSPVLIDSVVQVERTDPSLREAGEVPGNYRLSIHAIG